MDAKIVANARGHIVYAVSEKDVSDAIARRTWAQEPAGCYDIVPKKDVPCTGPEKGKYHV